MECWGAQGGGNSTYPGGKGSYTCGTLNISVCKIFYVVVGQSGSVNGIVYNNGFSHANVLSGEYWAGGGATDIRLDNGKGTWSDFNSRKSRIMVAASGGGSETYNTQFAGIPGGSLTGFPGTSSGPDGQAATAGSQTSCGRAGTGCHTEGYKGIGFGQVEYTSSLGICMGGAGNGYYSGGVGNHGDGTTGAGATGSCFISGHTGCNAIKESSTESNIIHTGSPNHYSGYVFSNTQMIAGNASMPTPSGGTEIGHSGHGACNITQLSF